MTVSKDEKLFLNTAGIFVQCRRIVDCAIVCFMLIVSCFFSTCFLMEGKVLAVNVYTLVELSSRVSANLCRCHENFISFVYRCTFYHHKEIYEIKYCSEHVFRVDRPQWSQTSCCTPVWFLLGWAPFPLNLLWATIYFKKGIFCPFFAATL